MANGTWLSTLIPFDAWGLLTTRNCGIVFFLMVRARKSKWILFLGYDMKAFSYTCKLLNESFDSWGLWKDLIRY